MFGHDTSIVSEANFETVFGGLHEGILSGIAGECRVNATSPATAQVRVEIGTFITGGVFAQVSATELKTIPANVSGQDRIDRIICRRDNATNAVTVEVLQGTPGAPPAVPALTRAGGVWDISLAQVYVANGFVTIAAEDIRSERDNPDFCGFVSGKATEQIALNLSLKVQWPHGSYDATGSNSAFDWGGFWEGAAVDDPASARLQDADGVALQQATSGLINAQAYLHTGIGFEQHRRDFFSIVELKFKLLDATSVRLFAGLSALAAAVTLAADDPAGVYMGVQFSTGRPDTNWQLVVDDGAVQTIVDTGVAVDTLAHFVRISCSLDQTEVLIELFDRDHEIEASAVFDANLPAAATWMFPMSGIEALVAAVRDIANYRGLGFNRRP